jgi:hypothetical protein
LTRVGGKLSDTQVGSRWRFGSISKTPEGPKASRVDRPLRRPRTSRDALASSFGAKLCEVVARPLSHFQLRLDARRKLRFSNGRDWGHTTIGLRRNDLASGGSIRQAWAGFGRFCIERVTRPFWVDIFAPRRCLLEIDKESRWLAAAVTLWSGTEEHGRQLI